MKERRKQRKPQNPSSLPFVSLSLFVSDGVTSIEKAQITVELSSDELEHPQLAGILADLDTEQDCACE
jgi:hypothetical protein